MPWVQSILLASTVFLSLLAIMFANSKLVSFYRFSFLTLSFAHNLKTLNINDIDTGSLLSLLQVVFIVISMAEFESVPIYKCLFTNRLEICLPWLLGGN